MPAKRHISMSPGTRHLTACPLGALIAPAGQGRLPAEKHVVELKKEQQQLHRVDREDPIYEDYTRDYQFSFGAVVAVSYSCANCLGADSNSGKD